MPEKPNRFIGGAVLISFLFPQLHLRSGNSTPLLDGAIDNFLIHAEPPFGHHVVLGQRILLWQKSPSDVRLDPCV